MALLEAVEASLQDELAEIVKFGGQKILPYATFFERGEARLRHLELAWLAENWEAFERALR